MDIKNFCSLRYAINTIKRQVRDGKIFEMYVSDMYFIFVSIIYKELLQLNKKARIYLQNGQKWTDIEPGKTYKWLINHM